MNRRPIPGDLLLHPVPIVALAVVIVNDRWLKVHHPGIVSGKLSDFAGLVYFPLFVASAFELARWIIRRDRWMIGPRFVDTVTVITGTVFALAKIWHPWAEAYRSVFGVVWWPVDTLGSFVRGDGFAPLGRLGLVQDPTDLVALPMLCLPPLIARGVARRRQATGAPPLSVEPKSEPTT